MDCIARRRTRRLGKSTCPVSRLIRWDEKAQEQIGDRIQPTKTASIEVCESCHLLFAMNCGKRGIMQPNHFGQSILVLLALSFSVVCPLGAQERSVPSPTQAASASTYPNTPEGLRQLLGEMLVAAKSGETEKLAGFVKDIEIPNCVEWHRKMFDAEKAERAIESCDSKVLNPNEKSLEEQFLHIAKREGDIAIRKVNDRPQPAYSRDWLGYKLSGPLSTYTTRLGKRRTAPRKSKASRSATAISCSSKEVFDGRATPSS